MFMVVAADWVEIHDELVAMGKERAQRDHVLGRVLLRARRGFIWEPLGIATFVEYAERTLGLTPRQSEDRVTAPQSVRRAGVPQCDLRRHSS